MLRRHLFRLEQPLQDKHLEFEEEKIEEEEIEEELKGMNSLSSILLFSR